METSEGPLTEQERAERLFRAGYDPDGPSHVSRAPGRVNLIGDHTDYNGLPVFPIAIQRAVRVWFTPRSDDHVRLTSSDASLPAADFRLTPEIEPEPAGDWRNYLQAAAQGVRALGPLQGMDGVVSGDLPIAAGLSSSSALVVAVAQALVHINRMDVDAASFSRLCARAERYVGTEGGGMDQAISVGGREGHALRIDFDPLRLTPVRVPDDWRFIVAFSGVTAEKSGDALWAYNDRARACAQALHLVESHLGRAGAGYPVLLTEFGATQLIERARAVLAPELLTRFRHTVTEGDRVSSAVLAMVEDDAAGFGALMTASHASLRDDFEVSSPELEQLVREAEKAGALGARLTGAGFGGSVVALERSEEGSAVLAQLEHAIASGRFPDGACAFIARPSAGADVRVVGG